MNIDNIEKCKMLLDKREKYIELTQTLDDELATVVITSGGRRYEFLDQDLNMALQDALQRQVETIEGRLATL